MEEGSRWFDDLMDCAFPELVRDKLGPLVTEHGFDVVEEADDLVVLDSPRVRFRAVLDPRGELEVQVFPKSVHSWEGWSYSGRVGRASVERLLELAVAQLQQDPGILTGDPDLFAALATQRRAESEAWTAYAAGKGPRPGKRRLP